MTTPIDREAVVRRHDVVLTAADAQIPLSVGNGDFACTVDITGMQSFAEYHDPRLAGDRLVTNTCTQTSWGWHETPNPDGYTLAEAMSPYETARGPVGYPGHVRHDGDVHRRRPIVEGGRTVVARQPSPARPRPRRTRASAEDRRRAPEPRSRPRSPNIDQRLELWTGTIHTGFEYAGETVAVTTAAHPERAEVAFRIHSSLLTQRAADGRTRLSVRQRPLPVHRQLGLARSPFDGCRAARWRSSDRTDTRRNSLRRHPGVERRAARGDERSAPAGGPRLPARSWSSSSPTTGFRPPRRPGPARRRTRRSGHCRPRPVPARHSTHRPQLGNRSGSRERLSI